jgi:Tfp pilus assembly protein PilX
MNIRSLCAGRTTPERGVALPLAMMMLVSLMALMLAFAVLAQHEPTIAANHSHAQQALQMANSGVERALWALSNSADASGIPASPTTAAAPYNGSQYISMNTNGGFTVQVTPGSTSSERTVTAVGWSPSNTALNKAHRKVQVIALAPPPPLNPPCAICVAGSTQIGGSAVVDSRNNGCGASNPPAAAVQSTGTTSVAGSGDVYGYGNNTKNQDGVDYVSGSDSSTFLYNQSNIDALKAMAKSNGTYYQGAITSIPTTGGVIFVDTLDGANYTSSTADSNAGSLTLTGNSTYPGIIIVAGSISLAGTTTFNGLVYALNDVTVGGNVTMNGALVSENRKDTSSTNIDSSATGSVRVNYHCSNVATGGGTVTLPTAWTVKSQSYAEQHD